jgi:hypothetical protein
MSVIHHGPLPTGSGEAVTVSGKPLHAGLRQADCQRRGVPTLWYNAHDLRTYRVVCFFTGDDFHGEGMAYVGTIQLGRLVLHYFSEPIEA